MARLRKTCFKLPEVKETVKWGHPTFEVGKRMFAVLDSYEGRTCIAFRAPPESLATLLADERFFPAPYAAKHGWVCMYADGRIDWKELRGLLQQSYCQVALKRMLKALAEVTKSAGGEVFSSSS